jgi:hypothetical protein
MRAKVRVSALSSPAGSWYWSNPIWCLLSGCPQRSLPTLTFALLALFDGYGWQTAALAGGGFYLVIWAAARLGSGATG